MAPKNAISSYISIEESARIMEAKVKGLGEAMINIEANLGEFIRVHNQDKAEMQATIQIQQQELNGKFDQMNARIEQILGQLVAVTTRVSGLEREPANPIINNRVPNNDNSLPTCGVWSHRAFLDETAFKDKSPPLYGNPMETMPLKVVPVPQYPTLQVSEFSPFAEIALAYFNCVQNVDFKLVQVTRVGYNIVPNPTMHINFDAKSNSGNPLMFYAELKTPSLEKIDEKRIEIKGCAMLEKVDTANPLGFSCSICKNKVIHPGPKDGYNVLVGDKFKDSGFWLYRPCVGLDCPTIKKSTLRYMDKYILFAKKAVKHLNCKVEADWELLVVTRVANRIEKRRKRFHMNFTVKSSNLKNEIQLCFAELFLPLFNGHSPDNWTMEKEPFLEVSGCCIMEKDAIYESPLGRVCDLCTGGLIHPGPRYGYRVLAGDDFAMYDFKTCGNGVFSE